MCETAAVINVRCYVVIARRHRATSHLQEQHLKCMYWKEAHLNVTLQFVHFSPAIFAQDRRTRSVHFFCCYANRMPAHCSTTYNCLLLYCYKEGVNLLFFIPEAFTIIIQ